MIGNHSVPWEGSCSPEDELRRACDEWMLDPLNKRFPTPGQLRELIADALRTVPGANVANLNANTWAVNRTMTALQRAFLIRTCTDSYYENRSRPCLLYQIKRCAGPCTGEVSLSDYDALVTDAEDFMRGSRRRLNPGSGGFQRDSLVQ